MRVWRVFLWAEEKGGGGCFVVGVVEAVGLVVFEVVGGGFVFVLGLVEEFLLVAVVQ